MFSQLAPSRPRPQPPPEAPPEVPLYAGNDSSGSVDPPPTTCVSSDPMSWITTGLQANVSQPTPRELTFSDDSLISVITYSTLFVVAAVGNLTVFIILLRNRRRRSRVNMFIMNLSLADMMVTFVMLPLEIGWHITVGWVAGDTACRILMFFRVFGFYLSSFILIAISFDRYFAIMHPLSLTDADRRGKIMLALAWLFSIVASIPQSVIFHVEMHPMFPWFTQCVTFGFFPSHAHELAYNLFNVIAMYLAPLAVILVTYSLILCEISRKTQENRQGIHINGNGHVQAAMVRSGGMGRIEKARIRTLKMTIVIVCVFVMCWTPYFVISAWWWIDAKSAAEINPKIQRALFIFAVSNSCVNPIVYGSYARTITRELKKCFRCLESGEAEIPMSGATAHPRLVTGQPQARRSKVVNSNQLRDMLDLADKNSSEEALPPSSLSIRRQMDSYFQTSPAGLPGSITPPHVAKGKGNKESFEKYLFI